ncbi:hypothetical protein CR513_49548, partial [Mucuna pruriens]
MMSKKARMEEESRIKIGECLKEVEYEMCLRREERDQALLEKQENLESMKNQSQAELKEERRKAEEWEDRVKPAILQHPYETRSKTRQMEVVVDDLEQHEELMGDVNHLKEQMGKILELLARGATGNTSGAVQIIPDHLPGFTPHQTFGPISDPSYDMPFRFNTSGEERQASATNIQTEGHAARAKPMPNPAPKAKTNRFYLLENSRSQHMMTIREPLW